MRDFWERLDGRSRTGLMIGVIVILAAVTWAGFVLLKPERDVLFNALAPQDAAAMTAELDKMKVPYQVSEDGQAILVDKAMVHKLRLKLMSRDVPLHGAVGFELFNNNDFGMTEFAQKVNYQRALQGEITRTILSLEEIETARVHLVFAEEGLLKRDPQKAKASVTVGLRHGRALKPDQVVGVQRLVAAAVPGIAVDDVTVLSQRGTVLSRSGSDATGEGTGGRADLQGDIEQQLNRKVAEVLTKAYGAEQFVSSVNVTLDMDQVKITSEEVLAPNAGAEGGVQGVLLRERETLTEAPGAATSQGQNRSSRDTEYQLGRRVEQVIKRPGAIERLQVLAVVRQRLDAAQLDRLKVALSAAVGAVADRGDVVTVQSLDMIGGGVASSVSPEGTTVVAAQPGAPAQPQWQGEGVRPDTAPGREGVLGSHGDLRWVVLAVVGGLMLLLAAVLIGRLSGARRSSGPPVLTDSERQQVLLQIRQWTDNAGASALGGTSSGAARDGRMTGMTGVPGGERR